MNKEPKTPKERDNLDLLNLTLELYARSASQPRNEKMHNYVVEAIEELKKRLTISKRDEFPDIYSGELNTERIKQYQELAELFTVQESTIRIAFCRGADWALSLCQSQADAVESGN